MGQVITIAQHKGGAGKTTVTAHLLVALAERGFKVAGLDTDPQGSLSSWFEARTKYFDRRCVDGVEVSAFSDWWRVQPEIDRLNDSHDFVLVDCPPHTKDDAEKAVRVADLVIVPIQPSPTDLWATTKTIDLTNSEDARTCLLLNRIISNSKISQQFIHDLPRCRFKTTIGNRVAYATSMGEGKTVIETCRGTAASAEMDSLADEVLAMMGRGINAAADQKAQRVHEGEFA